MDAGMGLCQAPTTDQCRLDDLHDRYLPVRQAFFGIFEPAGRLWLGWQGQPKLPKVFGAKPRRKILIFLGEWGPGGPRGDPRGVLADPPSLLPLGGRNFLKLGPTGGVQLQRLGEAAASAVQQAAAESISFLGDPASRGIKRAHCR